MSLAKFTLEHIGTISDSKPLNFDPFPIFENLRQSPSKPIISALRSRQMLEAILLRLAESTPCKHNARIPYMPFICLFYIILYPFMPIYVPLCHYATVLHTV